MKNHLPKVTTLLAGSAKLLLTNWKLMVIVAVVLVPSTVLGAVSAADGSAFGSIAAVLMNLALIWAIIELSHNRVIKVKDAYFKGTAAFIQFLVVALLLVLMLLPLIIALSIAGLGILPPQALMAERLLLGFLALLLSAPTAYWLTRYVFALFIVCESPSGPIAALKASGRLVKGHLWPVLGRLAVIAIIVSVLGSLPLILSAVLPQIGQIPILGIQLLTGIIGLPYLNLYLHQLYRSLDGQKTSG